MVVLMKNEVRAISPTGMPSRVDARVKTSHKSPVEELVRTLYANGNDSVVVETVTANAVVPLFGVIPP